MRAVWWRRHLDDERLFALGLAPQDSDSGPPVSEADVRHLAACGRCAARWAELEAFLRALGEEAVAAADEAFPPDRLLAQRVRIMRRVERLLADRGPARILPFPCVRRVARPTVARARRWIAAAAAVGLMVGAVAGRFFPIPPRMPQSEARVATTGSVERQRPSDPDTPGPVNEELLLLEIEEALGAPRVEELRAIDALTPRVQDVAFNFR